jgi:hypothetical protein
VGDRRRSTLLEGIAHYNTTPDVVRAASATFASSIPKILPDVIHESNFKLVYYHSIQTTAVDILTNVQSRDIGLL